METSNKGHLGDNINSADLFFVERFFSLGGSICIVGVILGLQVMSFVERLLYCVLIWESPLTVHRLSMVQCTSQGPLRRYVCHKCR